MNSAPEFAAGPLSTLDTVCRVMDRASRPLDFTVILRSPAMPDIERLRAGATSARHRYPISGSRIDNRQWIPLAAPVELIELCVGSNEAALNVLQEFVDRPFDLRLQAPVRQLLVIGAGEAILATRFHHAAADGASAALWLAHQMSVAHGGDEPDAGQQTLRVRIAQTRPPAVEERSSAKMWHRRGEPGRARRWRTIGFCGEQLRRSSGESRPFTYNDLLATIALDVLGRWNRIHGGDDDSIGLWLPVNIRREASSGFGNGTGRIRVHAPYADDVPFIDRCRRVHREISQSLRHREWAVPTDHPLMRLPQWLMAPVLRWRLERPWADMGTATFSHLEQGDRKPSEWFDRLERIECVAPLHARHCLSIGGVSRGNRTWLTFTYDPAQLTGADVETLTTMYLNCLAFAQRELACAA